MVKFDWLKPGPLINSLIFFFGLIASPAVLAYGLSIPGDAVNGTIVVRLETNTIIDEPLYGPLGKPKITDWWIEAGSTGSGAGRSDYFSSGLLEPPDRFFTTSHVEIIGPGGLAIGHSNAIVTNLPTSGDQVFLTISLKRENQPWRITLVAVIETSASSSTGQVEGTSHFRNNTPLGDYKWDRLDGATWYQVWINDEYGANSHNQWYSHNDVCVTTWLNTPDQCVLQPSFTSSAPYYGKFWVRAWNSVGGYGAWSASAELLND